jgi:hypothetical protein
MSRRTTKASTNNNKPKGKKVNKSTTKNPKKSKDWSQEEYQNKEDSMTDDSGNVQIQTAAHGKVEMFN